jgi:hypothetical protein
MPFLNLFSGTFVAQTIDDIELVEPEWRMQSGPRPVFRIDLEGTDLTGVKLRLIMSQDNFRTESYVFDQMKEPNGWAHTSLDEDFGVLFVPRRPLQDGRYQWRVDAWNGIEWIEGKDYSELDIDSVPPADVEGLSIRMETDGSGIVLEWDPVTTDRNGRPEWVERYHIYRYVRRNFFFVIRPFEIGVTDETRFVDRDQVVLNTPLVFYKITAEDRAGNEPGRSY